MWFFDKKSKLRGWVQTNVRREKFDSQEALSKKTQVEDKYLLLRKHKLQLRLMHFWMNLATVAPCCCCFLQQRGVLKKLLFFSVTTTEAQRLMGIVTFRTICDVKLHKTTWFHWNKAAFQLHPVTRVFLCWRTLRGSLKKQQTKEFTE